MGSLQLRVHGSPRSDDPSVRPDRSFRQSQLLSDASFIEASCRLMSVTRSGRARSRGQSDADPARSSPVGYFTATPLTLASKFTDTRAKTSRVLRSLPEMEPCTFATPGCVADPVALQPRCGVCARFFCLRHRTQLLIAGGPDPCPECGFAGDHGDAMSRWPTAPASVRRQCRDRHRISFFELGGGRAVQCEECESLWVATLTFRGLCALDWWQCPARCNLRTRR